MEFPLVERELARHAKRRWIYIYRTSAAVWAFIVLCFLWAVSVFRPDAAFDAEFIGNALYTIARVIEFGAAMFLPSLRTAGLIAREKQERTLGLLLLADYGGRDVYFAKLISAFIYIELIILGTLPVLAFASIFGGIEVSAMIVQVFLFSVCALQNCAIGLLCSTLAHRTGMALFTSLLLALGIFFVNAVIVTNLGNPFFPHAIHPAYDAWIAGDSAPTGVYWTSSLFVACAITYICAVVSIRRIPLQAYDPPARKRRRASASGLAVLRARSRFGRLFSPGPLAAIFDRGAGGFASSIRWRPVRVLLSFGLVMLFPFFCIGGIFVAALVAYDVLSSMESARRSGVWDDMRLTGSEPEDLVRTVYGVQYRRALFYLPAMAATGLYGIGAYPLVTGYAILADEVAPSIGVFGVALIVLGSGGLYLVLIALQLALLVAVACHASVDEKPVSTQTIGTVTRYAGVLIFNIVVAGFTVSAFALVLYALQLWFRVETDSVPNGWIVGLAAVVIAGGVLILTAQSSYDAYVTNFLKREDGASGFSRTRFQDPR